MEEKEKLEEIFLNHLTNNNEKLIKIYNNINQTVTETKLIENSILNFENVMDPSAESSLANSPISSKKNSINNINIKRPKNENSALSMYSSPSKQIEKSFEKQTNSLIQIVTSPESDPNSKFWGDV